MTLRPLSFRRFRKYFFGLTFGSASLIVFIGLTSTTCSVSTAFLGNRGMVRNKYRYRRNKNIIIKTEIIMSSSSMSPSSFQLPPRSNRNSNEAGLSKSHQGILNRMEERQRFVTGKHPLIVQVTESPTLNWLRTGSSISQLLINGTSIGRSLASFDKFQWLDDEEREELHKCYAFVSIELLAEINIAKPGYVNVLPHYGAGKSAAKLRDASSNENSLSSRWKRREVWEADDTGAIIDTTSKSSSNQDSELSFDRNNGNDHNRVWVTGFSMAGRKGLLSSIDIDSGKMESVTSKTKKSILWPNEVTYVPSKWLEVEMKTETPSDSEQKEKKVEQFQQMNFMNSPGSENSMIKDALLVSDGFLVPGKDQGGIYVIKNPGNPQKEWTFCLTEMGTDDDRWFYHRAVWIDLTGDGRKSILTARATLNPAAANGSSKSGATSKSNGQLVWLEMPKPYKFDDVTQTPLEKDGTVFDPLSSKHLPWKEHVLIEGPDVMFCATDLDTDDDELEVISSQFFGKQVTMHSIKRGPEPRVTFNRVIDDNCGPAFGCILTNLDYENCEYSYRHAVVDSGSTVQTLKPGDCFSHLLVTTHEGSYATSQNSHDRRNTNKSWTEASPSSEPLSCATTTASLDGGSLFAYRVPKGPGRWKIDEWKRTTVATGFKVQGNLGNVINPGAPGFVYTFYAKKNDQNMPGRRPLIAVAGDCAESVYLFRPEEPGCGRDEEISQSSASLSGSVEEDLSAQYKLMCEIKCEATVGSIGIGYDNFCDEDQENGYAKLYIPCYEKDKILVFALGSGEDDNGY